MSLTDFGDLITKLGVIGMLLVIVYGNYKGWWYSGHEYRRIREELDNKQAELEKWQTIAIRALGLADRASDQAVQAVERANGNATHPTRRRTRPPPPT